jgi:hypothetical protein
MHVVGHQRVGVQPCLLPLERLAKPVQVGVVVLLCEEAGLAVVAALHDVQRHSVDMAARAARHGETLGLPGQKVEPGPFNPLHPNSRRLIALLQVLLRFAPPPAALRPRPPLLCACCGAVMVIVRTRLPSILCGDPPVPIVATVPL